MPDDGLFKLLPAPRLGRFSVNPPNHPSTRPSTRGGKDVPPGASAFSRGSVSCGQLDDVSLTPCAPYNEPEAFVSANEARRVNQEVAVDRGYLELKKAGQNECRATGRRIPMLLPAARNLPAQVETARVTAFRSDLRQGAVDHFSRQQTAIRYFEVLEEASASYVRVKGNSR